MARTKFAEVKGTGGFYVLLGLLGAIVAVGGASAFYMEHHGHIVTGMSNQIVWGLPHVFAIFLIVAASGALNVASIASAFGRTEYKPLGRLSALLAIALLLGGLAILVLDLGRPERLVIALTTYNFKSIFAWNMLLYNGFMVIVGVYLFVQMSRGLGWLVRPVGTLALVWRLVLTTGTGSIFGWLVARQAYDAAVMAPLFIAMSLSFGTAIFLLVLMLANRDAGRIPGTDIVDRLGRLLGIFAAVVLYFTAVQHLTSLYAPERQAIERFLLLEGGIYTKLFWIGQVVVGGLAPMALLFLTPRSRATLALASILVIAGGLMQLYVIVIAGQAYPLSLFPGLEVSSSFYDGVVAEYSPSLPEFWLGIGGVAMALAATMVGLKVLRILPLELPRSTVGVVGTPKKTAAAIGA